MARKIENTIKIELDTLKYIIINTVPVEQFILLGSYAYGIPHKDSDLDIVYNGRKPCLN
jgi:predicted nucleotidyltransferase